MNRAQTEYASLILNIQFTQNIKTSANLYPPPSQHTFFKKYFKEPVLRLGRDISPTKSSFLTPLVSLISK